MNQPQRDAFELVRAGIRAVDAVFAAIAPQIGAILRAAPKPLTLIARRQVMRQIDTILNRTFGLTRQAALVSDLFRVITSATTTAADRPFLRLLHRVGTTLYRRDPLLYQRIFPRLLYDLSPLPRVWTLPDLDPTVPANWNLMVDQLRQQSAGERLLRSRKLDPQRRWVNGSSYRLSDRVWKQGRGVRRAIDQRIMLGIRNGEDPLRIARDLERYLDPAWQPIRMADGSIVVDASRKQVYTMKPRGGHGSNAARRLVRTEVMRIHGAATIEAARVVPGVIGVRWMLSGSHPDIDPCDDKASGSSRGLPRGVYTVDEVPAYPTHPNELCVLSHAHMPREQLIDQLVQQYGG